MKDEQVTEALEASEATALPKRKASEPFLILWEDGQEFKMSKDYILQYYTGKGRVKYSGYSGSFNEFYSFEEYSMSVKLKNKKKFILYLQVNKKHLSLRCSCNQSVIQLCIHAASVIYDLIPKHRNFHLKELYNETLLSLPQKFQTMLNVKLGHYWHAVSLELQNNSTFGRVYNLDTQKSYNDNKWSVTPFAYRGYKTNLPEVQHVEFLVVENCMYYELPYFLPYIPRNQNGRSITKSYLFYEGEKPEYLSPDDLFKEDICKKILMIADDDNYRVSDVINFDVDNKGNKLDRSLGILKEWRKLVYSLREDETLYFATLHRHAYYPNYANLKRAGHKRNFKVRLSNGDVRLQIQVEDNPSYLKLGFKILYQEQQIDDPRFIANGNCFFLIIEENQAVFIDDLDLERVLHGVRKFGYILTVLDRDRDKFLKEYLTPLIQRYELQVIFKGKKGNTFDQVKKPKGEIRISKNDHSFLVKASVNYEGFGRQELAPHANILICDTGDNGRYKYAKRYTEYEGEFYSFLKKQHNLWSDQYHESFFTISTDRIDHTQWLSQFVSRCREQGIKIQLDKMPRGTSYYPHRLRWEVREVHFEDNRCSFLFEPKFRGKIIPLEKFTEMIMTGPKVYDLDGGQFGVIQSSDISLFRPVFLSAEIEGAHLVLNSVQMIALQTILERIDPKIIQGSIRESRERLSKLDEVPQRVLPDTLHASLRPYQVDGFNWMAFLQEFQWGGILADDMGLGKTVQVITLLEHYYTSYGDSSATLVVMPNSLLFNWQAEYQKFAPEREVIVYHGPDRHLIKEFKENTIVLTTYGTLMSSIDFFEEHSFSYLVMDESQNAKNRNSKRFESLTKIKALYRIAMTGTPIENGIQDIYSQMSLVNPGFFGNYRAFNKMYSGTDEEGSEETLGSLQKMIQPFILRRTKKQVALDLPEKTETTLIVDMLPAQRKIYDKYRKLYQGEIADNLDGEDSSRSKFMAMEALNKLRQICNSPALLKDQSYKSDSIKLDHIDEIISEVVPGHKVLLFSFFTSMLQLVQERIKEKGVAYAYLDGKMPQNKRQESIERFQSDEECRIFLISLKAGGTGLNLTAADYVYILDPWWNPAAEAQAIDRCYRIGQEKHVNAYKIVCRDSVEEKIVALQDQKKRLAEGLILDEKNLMKSLSKEELLKLFE